MITTARMVTPGQMMAMMPTAIAKRPRQRNEVDSELNIGGPFYFSLLGDSMTGRLARLRPRHLHRAPVHVLQNHASACLSLGRIGSTTVRDPSSRAAQDMK